MVIPTKRGLSSLGVPPVDAEFVDAFRRWEQLQAAAASSPSGSAASTSAIVTGGSLGFADGLSAWLNPQRAVQEISAGFRNMGGTNVSYFAGLLSVPVALFMVLRRR